MMRSTTIAVVFVALICAANANLSGTDLGGIRVMTWSEFIDWVCKTSSTTSIANWAALCNSRTSTTTAVMETTDSTSSSTTSPFVPTSARDRWCKFDNGTYTALGYTFMRTECRLCRCTESRAFACVDLQCMPTHCVDGSTPMPKSGQCCPQCSYETKSTPCVVNGITFPHGTFDFPRNFPSEIFFLLGTILRQTSDNLQCWCQLGNVECRKSAAGAVFAGLDYWGSGTAVYVVVIIICVVLILGTLFCCSGTLLFYYYYKRRQQTGEQNYAEYYNNAGWQPMSEDGQTADAKQTEATQNEYPTGQSADFVPPPYAIYNGSYAEQAVTDGKQI